MDIPPYDNTEYGFRDSSEKAGRERVSLLLGLPKIPNCEGLQFELSFFSGSIGVYDKHAITMNADAELWSSVQNHLSAKTSAESASDYAWSEEFNWLIYGDDAFHSLADAVESFINKERNEFQDECMRGMTVLFQACSNVNDWAVLWGTPDRLNYLAFSQG